MNTTSYFRYTRQRPDRSRILDGWIVEAIENPVSEEVQSDGRIRRWAYVDAEAKYL